MRTFIAIELPASVRGSVLERQRTLEQRLHADDAGDAIRWTAVENLHLTLRFLGETDDSQWRALDQILQSLSSDPPSFSLTIGSFGCFPNFRRPTIVWLAIQGDLDRLLGIQAEVEQAARQAGFAAEQKAFKAHLTIGRVRRNADRTVLQRAGESLQRLSALATTSHGAAVVFRVEEIVLMQSDLQPAGPVYTPIGVYRLGGAASQTL